MTELQKLQQKSRDFRQTLWTLLAQKKKGHIPSSFSCLDVLITLFYGGFFKLPEQRKTDRLFISKGHGAMALYPLLVDLNLVEKKELELFCSETGQLRLYADPTIPLIEAVTGSLGHGLGLAIGHAIAMRAEQNPGRAYVILGDGECYEGSIWESALMASAYQLQNLTIIVDRNRQCIMGQTEELLPLGDLAQKWRAFGFETQEVDGHHFPSLIQAFKNVPAKGPQVLIAHTIKGKGISFMENQADWHNKIPSAEQFIQGQQELALFCPHEEAHATP